MGPYIAFMNRVDALGDVVGVVATSQIWNCILALCGERAVSWKRIGISHHYIHLTIYTIQLNGTFCFICLLTSSSLAQFALEAMHTPPFLLLTVKVHERSHFCGFPLPFEKENR